MLHYLAPLILLPLAAVMRAAAMGWVLRNHTTDDDEVVRTLGTMRGQVDSNEGEDTMSPIDR